jgi:hypothetical protein
MNLLRAILIGCGVPRHKRVNIDEVEHALYLVLVGVCEVHLNLDPCPAIREANSIASSTITVLKTNLGLKDD